MRIQKGMIVRFMGADDEQVNWGKNDDPRDVLEINGVYEVSEVEVHSWHTKIQLVDSPNNKFNSACFEIV